MPEWNDRRSEFPATRSIPAADKYVMQYPPGTGFVLALFPEGFQVIPLYVLANLSILAFALLALVPRASTPASLALAAVFGLAALYLMINPTKASYSVAPTMMVCALAGFLTAKLFTAEPRHRLLLIALVGPADRPLRQFPPAQSVSGGGLLPVSCRRVPAGAQQGDFPAGAIVRHRLPDRDRADADRECDQCGQSVLDHLWRRRRRAARAEHPAVLLSYLVDVQFTLLAISVVWTAWLWRFDRGRARQVAGLVALNLAVNLIFFMTHPIFTPYYIIPIDMLSLWTLLFATLDLRGERAADSAAFPQPANA